MALINLPTDHLRDTCFGQELLAEGEACSAGVALLDFSSPANLVSWLDEHDG